MKKKEEEEANNNSEVKEFDQTGKHLKLLYIRHMKNAMHIHFQNSNFLHRVSKLLFNMKRSNIKNDYDERHAKKKSKEQANKKYLNE
jgi:formylmethanofuran dehydrogenase subunit E